MGNILGTGHVGMRFASIRCPEQGAGGARVWAGVLQSRLNPSSGLQGGEVGIWSQSIGSKGLVLCSVHAQQCQHFHKTRLGSRTPLLGWLSKQQETSQFLIKMQPWLQRAKSGERGCITAASAEGHGKRVLWPSMSADFFSSWSPMSHFKY